MSHISVIKLPDNSTYDLKDSNAIPTSQKGAANGVVPLNNSSKIDSTYLPSYVDDVIEGYYYNNKFWKESTHTTEIIGEAGKIYIDISQNPATTYRYSGSAFVQIGSGGSVITITRNLTSGVKSATINIDGTSYDLYSTDDTTYESKAAVSGGTAVSLVTTGEKAVWNAKTSNTGTVTKITAGTGLTGGDITTSGTIALATSGATAGSYGDSTAQTPAYGGTFKVPYVTVDTYGRVTGISEHTVKIPASDNTTYSAGTGLGLSGTTFSVKLGYTTSGNNRAVQADSNGNLYVTQKDDNTNYYHTTGSWSGLTYTATANGGAGALALTLPTGTSATTVAVGNHTHATSIATSSGTNQLTLAANTKYAITAGGTSYVFTTPPDTNTWRGIQNNLTSDSTSDSLSAAQGKALANGSARDNTKLPLTGGTVTGAVTFGSSVSMDEATVGDLVVSGAASCTNNLQVNTINGVTVGSSPKFTDNNTTYSAGTGLSLSGTTFSAKLGYTTSGNNRAVQADSNGNLYVVQKDDNTTYSAMSASEIKTGTATTLRTMRADYLRSGLLDLFYPVGAYYYTSSSTFNPNDDWGGTWSLVDEGKVLLSGSASGTYKVGTSYGGNTKSYTPAGSVSVTVGNHTLTAAEIPSHNHGERSFSGTLQIRQNTFYSAWGFCSGVYSGTSAAPCSVSGGGQIVSVNFSNSHTHDGVGSSGAHSHSGSGTFTGTEATINVMQSSDAVYIWHRTA